MKYLIFRIFIIIFISITFIDAQTVIIDDPLQGSTLGTKVGGTLTSEGYQPRIGKYFKPGTSEDHILYNVGSVIENGYVEFQVKGFDMSDFDSTSSSLPSREHGFMVLYDGRGVSEPLKYDPDAKHNYFYWVIHYRSEKYQSTAGNKWKTIINCAEPRSERINSTRAVFTDATGDFGLVEAQDGTLNILDRDWTVEPNGLRNTWDPNRWYTIKVEWNNDQFKVYRDGQMVWFNELEEGQPWTAYDNSTPQAVYPWKPLDLRIWLGSAPGRYDNDMPNILYRNFKLVDLGNSNPVPSITVTSPNGNEVLIIGDTHQIRWNSTLVSNVSIDFSSDNGSNWSSITSSTASDGFYSWLVPDVSSNQCRIRITDVSDGDVFDISNNNFVIQEQPTDTVLNILTPNGGEEWLIGKKEFIFWNTPLGTDNVILFFSSNYDPANPTTATWTTIGTSPNVGSYEWTVPNAPSNMCAIRIKDVDDFTDVDISDQNFTIREYNPSIELLDPNGGELFYSDSTYSISWNSQDVNYVKVEYSINNGSDWLSIEDSLENSGNYLWLIPKNSSENCLVRITDLENDLIFDVSDNVFEIEELIIPLMNILSPVGGEVLTGGTIKDIIWESEYVADVKIDYTDDGGSNWKNIVDSTESDGAFIWNLPNINSANCLVRITNLMDSTNFSISDSVFTINEYVVNLSILKPVGGEVYQVNTNEEILWESENVQYVMIDYTIDNGNEWINIVDSALSSGNYSWLVPNTISDSCKIRIVNLNDFSVFSESPDLFEITDVTDAIVEETEIPNDFYLKQNYPNPFNPTTKITYGIPTSENVEIVVYNILGKKIRTLVNGVHSAGRYTIDFDSGNLPSGIYLYRINSGNYSESKSMLLLK